MLSLGRPRGDLGLLVIPETSFPPPWLGFTYDFGG